MLALLGIGRGKRRLLPELVVVDRDVDQARVRTLQADFQLAQIRTLAGFEMRRDDLQIVDMIAVRDHLGKIEGL